MRSWKPALAAGLLGCVALRTFAGGGPCNYIVLYDQTDTNSVAVANYYQQARNIPERNMVPYTFFPAGKTSFARTNLWDLALYLRQVIQDRGLTGRFNGIAVAGTVPLMGKTDRLGFQAGLYYAPNLTGPADYLSYNSDNFAFAAPTNPVTREIRDDKSFTKGAATNVYWPVSFVGFTGVNGNTPEEVFSLIDRSKAADGVRADGVIYWPTNGDALRVGTRLYETNAVLPVWDARGIRYLLTAPPGSSAYNESGRPDIAGLFAGAANIDAGINGNTYIPGAWADHLTSNGGNLNTLINGQSSACTWLRAGAYGSSGTTAEPYAIAGKFPHAHIHTHLRAGASMAEAFWQSMQTPYEIIMVGDPLLQAWAQFPQVSISSPSDEAVLSGTVAINAGASTVSPDGLESQYELAVDGHVIRIGDTNETISAAWTGSGFALDTATLADGWHELRVIAYNNNAVHTQGEARRTVFVNNSSQSVTLSGPSALEYTSNGTFTVNLSGIANATNVTIQANGRTLANLSTAGGSTSLSAALLGYKGVTKLYALAWLNNGQQIWSAPLDVNLDWTPSAATNVIPGSSIAQIRYFSSTTDPGFDWDSTAPDAVTNFAGPVLAEGFKTAISYRSYSVSTNYLPDYQPGSYANRPGFDSAMYFLAPVDGLYEFMIDDTSITGIWMDVDGKRIQHGISTSDGSIKPVPVKLAAGFHPVRLRFQATASDYSAELWYRGGTSPGNINCAYYSQIICSRMNEVVCFGPAVTNNAAPVITGGPVSTPVSSTKAMLSVTAGDADGGTNLLSYSWAKIDGPGQMTVYSNAAGTCFTNLATFSRAGSYRVRVMVSDGLSVATGEVTAAVDPVYSTVSISPSNLTMLAGTSVQLSAVQKDQFGTGATNRLFAWSVQGGGSVTGDGLYTAPAAAGTNLVTVQSGTNSATGTIIVLNGSVPAAGFSASPVSGWMPLPVTFTDTSTGTITNRFWDFGDGVTTNTAATTVSHTYTAVGTRTVQLIVSGPDGVSTNTQDDLISVTLPIAPSAGFSATPASGTAPLEVSFTDTSTGSITNRFWSFGDGATTNTAATDITHTYMTAGTNTVQLIVSGPAGVSTNTQVAAVTVTLPPAPSAGFSAAPTSGTAPLPVTFTDTSTGSITSRFWDFGDGATTNTTATSVLHVYTVPGTNTVRLIVSGAGGSSTNTQAGLINVAAGSAGTLLFYDDFSSAEGNLLGTMPDTGGTWGDKTNSPSTTPLQVSTTGLTAPAGFAAATGGAVLKTGSGNDSWAAFTAQSTGTVFYSLLFSATGVTTSAGGMVASLGSAYGADYAQLRYEKAAGDSFYRFGLTARGTTGVLMLTNQMEFGSTHLLVMSYTFVAGSTNDIINLWLDPVSFGGAAPAASLTRATLTTDTAAIDSIRLGNKSVIPNASKVDELRVGTSWASVTPAAVPEPAGDADSDGIPDEWETMHFGGSTNANPNAMAANGINTIYETYIAGLNPTNAQSVFALSGQQAAAQMKLQWSAVSGRVYSVYWTTNLINGFQALETNIIWPQNSWTDMVHGAEADGFYRLKVRIGE